MIEKTKEKCSACGGVGEVYKMYGGTVKGRTETSKCNKCKGTGKESVVGEKEDERI